MNNEDLTYLTIKYPFVIYTEWSDSRFINPLVDLMTASDVYKRLYFYALFNEEYHNSKEDSYYIHFSDKLDSDPEKYTHEYRYKKALEALLEYDRLKNE